MMISLHSCVLSFLLAVALPLCAQTQTGATPAQDRTELLKAKPNISGQRNGVFIEPDAMDFSDHTGYSRSLTARRSAAGMGAPVCGTLVAGG
jgi:hypothetical protein